MKNLIFLLLLLCLSLTQILAQDGLYDLRFVKGTNNLSGKFDLQLEVKASKANTNFHISDQNYRFSFSDNALANPRIKEELTLSSIVTTTTPSTLSFYSPHTLTGSLGNVISYNIELSGGNGYPLNETDWVPIGIVEFDLVDPNACVWFTWHTQDPLDFPNTFVGEIYPDYTLASADEGSYKNLQDCPQNSAQLPITLLNFEASLALKTIVLEWETAMEINNDRFVIERSVNGVDFHRIGMLLGQGTTTTYHAYKFVDKEAYFLAPRVFYYRLKQLDDNGQYTYSPIEVIKMASLDTEVSTYPNPVENELTVRFSSESQEDYSLSILNNLGQEVRYLDPLPRHTETIVDLSDLPAGSYWLRIQEGEAVTSRLLIKH